MGKSTRIFSKFRGYSTKGCDCRGCVYYCGKKRGCLLDECCCEDERAEALKRKRKAYRAAKNEMVTDNAGICY